MYVAGVKRAVHDGRGHTGSRYRRINEFEKELTDQGVLIVKIFLHVSKDQQKARLQARLDRPEKRWKFSPADLETRKHWDEFHKVYAEVIARTGPLPTLIERDSNVPALEDLVAEARRADLALRIELLRGVTPVELSQ